MRYKHARLPTPEIISVKHQSPGPVSQAVVETREAYHVTNGGAYSFLVGMDNQLHSLLVLRLQHAILSSIPASLHLS